MSCHNTVILTEQVHVSICENKTQSSLRLWSKKLFTCRYPDGWRRILDLRQVNIHLFITLLFRELGALRLGSVSQRCCLLSASLSPLILAVGERLSALLPFFRKSLFSDLPFHSGWTGATGYQDNAMVAYDTVSRHMCLNLNHLKHLIKQFSLFEVLCLANRVSVFVTLLFRELGAWRLGSVCQRCCLLSASFSPLTLAVGQRLSALLPYFRKSLSCNLPFHSSWTRATVIQDNTMVKKSI